MDRQMPSRLERQGKEICGSALAFAVLKARHTQGAGPAENPQHGLVLGFWVYSTVGASVPGICIVQVPERVLGLGFRVSKGLQGFRVSGLWHCFRFSSVLGRAPRSATALPV